MPRIIASLNPLINKRFETTVAAGKPLSHYLTLPDGLHIELNGEMYGGEALEEGDLVNLTVVPRGGGQEGKDIARQGIILAAQVVAAIATSGMSKWAQIGITAAATAAGTWAAYEIIPLPRPQVPLGPAQPSRLSSLTGSRNQINPYGVVPRVYGKRKIYPPMSARPFTEVVGNDQYLRLLFVIGAGPVQLAKPKIGNTAIGSFNHINL